MTNGIASQHQRYRNDKNSKGITEATTTNQEQQQQQQHYSNIKERTNEIASQQH